MLSDEARAEVKVREPCCIYLDCKGEIEEVEQYTVSYLYTDSDDKFS